MLMWDEASPYDRLDDVRTDQQGVAYLWRGAAQLVVADGSFAVVEDPAQPVGIKLRLADATGAYDAQRHILLGRVDGRVLFTVAGPVTGGVGLREALPRLPAAQAAAATAAVALHHWHALEPRCPACGGGTARASGGVARCCEACSRELFPRTDPAVIVAIIDDEDRLLLGHQRAWDKNRYSVLAGFVEAGESLEQAVHREVFEESGIRLTAVKYVASQPWPFPRSLMLGFQARAATTSVQVDGVEIADARWFSRDELRLAVAAGEVVLPGIVSIAFRLISDWLHEESKLADSEALPQA